MSYGFRAHIHEEFEWQRVRLMLMEQIGDRQSFLLANGTWWSRLEGYGAEAPPEDHGLVLPEQSLDAIIAAIKRFKGDALDSTTESKVLREALDIERRRVDRVLGGMT